MIQRDNLPEVGIAQKRILLLSCTGSHFGHGSLQPKPIIPSYDVLNLPHDSSTQSLAQENTLGTRVGLEIDLQAA